jgi:hypothetical protein
MMINYKNESKGIYNKIQSIYDTRIFINKPAKEVFYNLGGFKVFIPTLHHFLEASATKFNPTYGYTNSFLYFALDQ